MRLLLFLFLVLLASAGVWASNPVVFPVTYCGGVGRTIYTTLTLYDAQTYSYDEWTHAGYSVHDSGHYRLTERRLVLSSLATVHRERNRWRRLNGKRVNLLDTLTNGLLFRHTKAHRSADTVVITKRRVLFNKEFGMFLVKRR